MNDLANNNTSYLQDFELGQQIHKPFEALLISVNPYEIHLRMIDIHRYQTISSLIRIIFY